MTENINDKNETSEMIQRREAGKAGKLWIITVLCRTGSVTRKWMRMNLYYSDLLKAREDMFIYGVMIQEDPSHYIVIPPGDMLDIRAERQKSYLTFDPSKE